VAYSGQKADVLKLRLGGTAKISCTRRQLESMTKQDLKRLGGGTDYRRVIDRRGRGRVQIHEIRTWIPRGEEVDEREGLNSKTHRKTKKNLLKV